MADDDGSGAADDRTYKNYRDTDCPSGDCDTAHFRIYEKEKMDSVWRYEIRIIRADEEKLSKKKHEVYDSLFGLWYTIVVIITLRVR